MRPHHRLKLLTLGTRNRKSRKPLLYLKKLCGIEVLVYEPRSRASAGRIMRDVNGDIFDVDRKTARRATEPCPDAWCIHHYHSVKIMVFTGETPEYVTVGYTPYKVHPYGERPNLYVPNQCAALTAMVSITGTPALLNFLSVQGVGRTMSPRHGNVIFTWQRKKYPTTALSTTSTTPLHKSLWLLQSYRVCGVLPTRAILRLRRSLPLTRRMFSVSITACSDTSSVAHRA